ncbi:MAG TPA: nucleotide sugar dehydrogenase [Thermoanaerobaculia bacterium]|nr:nucleotide sugar dehydrogenase [Thermoanaerobaculia bacterium]
MSSVSVFPRDVCVIGGGGHVGLPLALTFADSGCRTVIYDTNARTVERIRSGEMPFSEEGAPDLLRKVLAGGLLEVDATPERMAECRFLVLVIGTPVDQHLTPSFSGIRKAIDACAAFLRDGQILILRSTIFPGISEFVQKDLAARGLDIPVAFCPERVAQGLSLREIRKLPQIVSAFHPATLAAVRELFGRFVDEFIEMTPMEAELCKLMTNATRYIQFAIANQFYTIAREQGLDFDRILHGCRHNYPRMAFLPGPGFAAGPCLLKDTMQLAAFSRDSFPLGHSAMLVNEGLPARLVELARRDGDLSEKTVGVLGMAFKAESDDARDSLSYKLKNLLALETARVLCTDPYVPDPTLVPLERVVAESDVLFLATPHRAYRSLRVPKGKVVYDVWNWIGSGAA